MEKAHVKDGWLTPKEVAALTRRAVASLANDRYHRRGLPYTKFGRSVRYRYSDVQEFLQKRRVSFDEVAG